MIRLLGAEPDDVPGSELAEARHLGSRDDPEHGIAAYGGSVHEQDEGLPAGGQLDGPGHEGMGDDLAARSEGRALEAEAHPIAGPADPPGRGGERADDADIQVTQVGARYEEDRVRERSPGAAAPLPARTSPRRPGHLVGRASGRRRRAGPGRPRRPARPLRTWRQIRGRGWPRRRRRAPGRSGGRSGTRQSGAARRRGCGGLRRPQGRARRRAPLRDQRRRAIRGRSRERGAPPRRASTRRRPRRQARPRGGSPPPGPMRRPRRRPGCRGAPIRGARDPGA